MTTPANPEILTRRTTANLSAKPYYLVKASGDNDLAVAGDGELCIGALTNSVADGSSTAAFVPVQVGGTIKVKCGGAITAGTLAAANSDGKAVAVADGEHAFGIALETHADGDIGTFLWAPSYFENT